MPLGPCKEPFDHPATLIAAQLSSVLRLGHLASIGAMRRNHGDVLFFELIIQIVTVIGLVTDQLLRLGFNYVEVKCQLYQRHFMMVGGMRADRQRKSMPIHNPHDFHAFSAFCGPNGLSTPLGRRERGVNKTFRFIHLSVALSQLFVPLSIVGLSAIGYYLHPPRPTSDPLGPSPWWSLIVGVPLALILATIGSCMTISIIFKILRNWSQRDQHS